MACFTVVVPDRPAAARRVRPSLSPRNERTDEDGAMTTGTASCAYPDCDRPVAPPPPTGGRSSYCDRPDHNRTTAFAARPAQATARTPGASERPAAAQPGPRPAETLAGVADRLAQTLAAIEEELGSAREVLTRAADAELLEVERAAIRTDARREIAEADQRAALADRVRAVAERS